MSIEIHLQWKDSAINENLKAVARVYIAIQY